VSDAPPLDDRIANLDAAERLAEREVREVGRQLQQIQTEIAQVIIGQRPVVRQALAAVLAGGHVLIEGIPGVGKTLLIRTLATVLGLDFSRVQCTPDLIPADVTGTNILAEGPDGAREFRFQPGPIFSRVVRRPSRPSSRRWRNGR
jgi:MoxR-like ATPase